MLQYLYLVSDKPQVFQPFKDYKAKVEKQLGRGIKITNLAEVANIMVSSQKWDR